MVMHLNGSYEENEMIGVEQAWPSRQPRDFSTEITLIFHSHYHRLLLPTKRAKNIMEGPLLNLMAIIA